MSISAECTGLCLHFRRKLQFKNLSGIYNQPLHNNYVNSETVSQCILMWTLFTLVIILPPPHPSQILNPQTPPPHHLRSRHQCSATLSVCAGSWTLTSVSYPVLVRDNSTLTSVGYQRGWGSSTHKPPSPSGYSELPWTLQTWWLLTLWNC